MEALLPPWPDSSPRDPTVIDGDTGEVIPAKDAFFDERAQKWRRRVGAQDPGSMTPAELGAWVRSRRRGMGISQEELGAIAGCSGRVVRDIELNRASDRVRLGIVRAIVEALGGSVEVAA